MICAKTPVKQGNNLYLLNYMHVYNICGLNSSVGTSQSCTYRLIGEDHCMQTCQIKVLPLQGKDKASSFSSSSTGSLAAYH